TAATPIAKLWQPLTAADAERGRAAVQSLSRPTGPVYANLTASEAASYIFLMMAKQLPPTLRNAEAAVIGSRLYVRSEVELKELGGSGALGALGAFLGPRDSVTLGGTINMLGPGRGEFLVQEVKIGRLDLPTALIPRIVARIKPASRTAEVSANGLPMVMPEYISDVRISNGKITVYKTTG
ncbi:MAG: hypothetical protein M3365_10660, partial [Gemmatimonadota bacterium]|nr:hypothetical protein [Gemmatimonadota bacterium]